MNAQSIIRAVRSAVSIKLSLASGFRSTPAPLFMVWEATYRCNLDCSRCYVGDSRDEPIDALGTEEIEKIIGEAAHMGLFCLVVTGGEPLLREDIHEVRAYAAGLGLFVSITTNGTLLDEAAMRAVSRFDQVTLSVDADHENSYRTREMDGDGYLSRMVHAARTLKQRSPGIIVCLQTVINARNWPELLDFNGRSFEAGIDTVFQLEYGCDFAIDEARWRAMVDRMRFRSGALGWIQKKYLRLFPMIARGEVASPCLALTSNFVVSPEGRLLPCNFRRDAVADLRSDAPFPAVWRDLGDLRRLYASARRGCTCANTCFIPAAMLLS